MPTRAGCTSRRTDNACRAGSRRCGFRLGSSPSSRCPAAGWGRPAGHRAAGGAVAREAARTGQQVDGLANDRALDSLPRPRSVLAGRVLLPVATGAAGAGAVGARVVAEAVELDAQPEKIIQGVRVRRRPQSGPSRRRRSSRRRRRRPATLRRRCRRLRPRPGQQAQRARPWLVQLLEQGQAAVQYPQVRERVVHPGLRRWRAGPPRPPPGTAEVCGQQRLLQRVVAPLGV